MVSTENYDPCFPDQPVVDRYLPIWACQPCFRSKPAFIWAEDDSSSPTPKRASITYSELNTSVAAIATRLLQHPLRRRDAVLVICPPGLLLVKLIFACQRAGLIAIPMTPQSPTHPHLLRAISQARPKSAIAHPDFISAASRHPQLHHLLWLSTSDFDAIYDYHPADLKYAGCGSDETYLIQYTSGATGIPKPVLITAGAAAHNVRVARKAYDLQPSSVIVSWLPQYHDCGLMFLLLTVVSGATCVLTSPTAFLRRPRLWLELISEFRGTCTPVPSFTLQLTIARGRSTTGCDRRRLQLQSLTNLILINEPIYSSPVEEFVKEFSPAGLDVRSISPSYGLAENCTFVCTAWVSDGSSVSMAPAYNKLLPSARLSPYEEEMRIVVVDEDTWEAVDDGIEGEIWVSSPSNASGYLGHPSLTREVFAARIKGRAGPCFVRTGDRGVVRGEERYLYVVGRTVDAMKVAGWDRLVHPHYLETVAYKSNPSFLRGGCIAAFEVREDVVVVAELQRGGEKEGVRVYKKVCDGIRDGCEEEEGVRVGMVVLVESGSVPKTTSGKLRRWEAKEKLLARRFPVRYRSSSTEEVCGGRVLEDGIEGEVVARSANRFRFMSFL